MCDNLLDNEDIFGFQAAGFGGNMVIGSNTVAEERVEDGKQQRRDNRNGQIEANNVGGCSIGDEEYGSLSEWPSSASPLLRLALGSPGSNINFGCDLFKKMLCEDGTGPQSASYEGSNLFVDGGGSQAICLDSQESARNVHHPVNDVSQLQGNTPFLLPGIALDGVGNSDTTELFLNESQQLKSLQGINFQDVRDEVMDVAFGLAGNHIESGNSLDGITSGWTNEQSHNSHPETVCSSIDRRYDRRRRRRRRHQPQMHDMTVTSGNTGIVGWDCISVDGNARGGAVPETGGGRTEEEIRKIRRVKNRASVEKCRMKQRQRMEALERELRWLQQENSNLHAVTKCVRGTFETIRTEVSAITGRDVVMPGA